MGIPFKRTVRLLASASVLLLGLLPLPTVAQDVVPSLAGRTTIWGSVTSVMLVDVPAPATVSWIPSDNEDVTVEGEGRFVGVVLTADIPTLDGPTLVAGRIPMDAVCWPGRGCPVGPVVSVHGRPLHVIDWNAGTIRLPAGRYRLFLIADGSSARFACCVFVGSYFFFALSLDTQLTKVSRAHDAGGV